MLSTSILEVAIGLVFVYLLMSLICSAANEMIESVLKNRATDLERGIRELFNQDGGAHLVANFYKHPLISGLFRGEYRRERSREIGFVDYLRRTNLPSYIPAGNFAYAVLDLALHPPAEVEVVRDDSGSGPQAGAAAVDASALPVSMEAIRLAVRRNLGHTQVGRALRTLAEESGDDINAMRENVKAWFDAAMDRVSGAYTRRTKWIIFVLGLVLTVFLNVNTITIARSLSKDATLRSVIVAQAEGFADNADAQKANFEVNRSQLEGLGLPIGWPTGIDVYPFKDGRSFNWWENVLLPMIGWLLTAAAISLGAPFWFDLLNKFLVIRATVKPREKSPEEGSEDRQQRMNLLSLAATGTLGGPAANTGAGVTRQGFVDATAPEPLSTPEPDFAAGPDPEDNESHLDEGDEPIEDVTPDEDLPPTKGGVG